jgi:hypothetical protein
MGRRSGQDRTVTEPSRALSLHDQPSFVPHTDTPCDPPPASARSYAGSSTASLDIGPLGDHSSRQQASGLLIFFHPLNHIAQAYEGQGAPDGNREATATSVRKCANRRARNEPLPAREPVCVHWGRPARRTVLLRPMQMRVDPLRRVPLRVFGTSKIQPVAERA